MEKSKFIFSLPGLDICRMLSHFIKGLKITYQSIFLSARSDNVKSVKRIMKKNRYQVIGTTWLTPN